MSYKSIIFLSIIFFTGIYHQQLKAQSLNINGDTIFVNAEAEIQIDFPTLPKSFSTAPNNAPYHVKSVGTGVNLIAAFENAKPAILSVSEAGRNHRFIIVFKKDINYSNESEIFYDYSTEKKLEQHIKETAHSKSKTPEKPADKVVPKSEPVDNTTNYYALLEDGERNIKLQEYTAAKSDFDKAHILRPDALLPVQRLEEIKVKMAGPSALAPSKVDKNYSAIIAEGIIYLNQKNYAQAKEAYKQALEIRPGDLYAMHQMESIIKLEEDADGKKEQQKFQNLYNDYISQAEKAFAKNQWSDARVAYEQALVIKPNDAAASRRLKVIEDKEKIQLQTDALENNYNTAVQLGDKSFQEGDFDNAKTEYNKALGFSKKAYPQEQLKKIEKSVIEKALKDNIAKQELAKQLAAEAQAKDKQALEDKYDAAVQLADKFFKEANYDNAKIQYNKALDFIRKDWPAQQIIEINKLVAAQIALENTKKQEEKKQEIENKYNGLIASADKFFDAGDYANAKAEYNKAMSIVAKPYPQDQIKKINKLVTDQITQANEEKIRLAVEAAAAGKYTTIIKNADAEFDKNNFIKAKKLYADALKLKQEDYPKERLLTIDNYFVKSEAVKKARTDSIAQVADINRQYSLAMSKAKSYIQKDDLLNAKTFYLEAAGLKPEEEEPKKQVSNIANQVRIADSINEINDRYDGKIFIADSLLNAKEYDAAVVVYNEALAVKPAEKYPKSQMKFIQSEVLEIKKINDLNKRREDELRYKDALASANKAVTDKRYRDAKSAYIEVLSIHPDNAYAKDRLRIVDNQLQLARAGKQAELAAHRVELPPPPPVAKPKKKSKKDKPQPLVKEITPQAVPITYNTAELKSKYPNIDFTTYPPEQPLNKSLIYSKEDTHMFESMLSAKSRLDSSSEEQGIKLICQGINFGETVIYVKMLIQNYSNADFLTGAMMLTWTRKTGNLIKLYPHQIYPSPLPIIKPGNEIVVIYVCKSYDIADEESLNFELTDRMNKAKVQVKIPGTAYNQEWIR